MTWRVGTKVPLNVLSKAEADKRRTADHSKCQRMYPVLGMCERVPCQSEAPERHHVDGDTTNNTRHNVEFLCYGCHKLVHGDIATGRWRPPQRQPAKPCRNCTKLAKPTWYGRCHTCNQYFRRTGTERPIRLVHGYSPLLERFNASFIPEPNTGCWLWMAASTSAEMPRPTIRENGRRVVAHRVAYRLFVGPIPEGRMICHRCDVPMCVNPDHLYAGDAKSNAQDCLRRGRHAAQLYPDLFALSGKKLGDMNTWTRNSRMPFAVIPHEDLPGILAERESGVFLKDIAVRYRVSATAVCAAIYREKRRMGTNG